ncbi:uncharacterized protein MONOS_8662 [Monocercomonoides exilis]|uniref:uncharacterized protein n=1 Tax=Monocercomonoides exilis TaxID=2049356 RepID=UPI00355A1588|nr:hypothetical protein MONOS_8662 [Monocercomonoides exilis]|eukprot:MONOS_8662.1-p1 / transcript=MONOS_8662.1 / gene=MONOS_8662 / organism=Monocercomonoides_exilis_PA203 / gene_product=unspecified product / transcript_product=unspecified product / location=Mono_scaffold00332:54741-56166(-) / protein_length=416 / sequence_SO=supercontig / SO=protein_coding / is_pseudo=false
MWNPTNTIQGVSSTTTFELQGIVESLKEKTRSGEYRPNYVRKSENPNVIPPKLLERKEKDIQEYVDSDPLSQYQQKLELKAKLYEKLSSGKMIDDYSAVSVNFTKKIEENAPFSFLESSRDISNERPLLLSTAIDELKSRSEGSHKKHVSIFRNQQKEDDMKGWDLYEDYSHVPPPSANVIYQSSKSKSSTALSNHSDSVTSSSMAEDIERLFGEEQSEDSEKKKETAEQAAKQERQNKMEEFMNSLILARDWVKDGKRRDTRDKEEEIYAEKRMKLSAAKNKLMHTIEGFDQFEGSNERLNAVKLDEGYANILAMPLSSALNEEQEIKNAEQQKQRKPRSDSSYDANKDIEDFLAKRRREIREAEEAAAETRAIRRAIETEKKEELSERDKRRAQLRMTLFEMRRRKASFFPGT